VSPTEETNQQSGAEPDRGQTVSRQRWASLLGIAAVILILALIIVLHLTGAIGPGTH
jgi:hypothetical protein